MTSSNSQIEQLKQLLGLEEKRVELQAQLSALDTQLAGLKKALISGTPAPAAAVAKAAPAIKAAPVKAAKAPKAPKAGKPAKAGRGELKSRIFAALEKAGAKGVKVLDLAQELKTAPANIYAWFHAAVKRYPEVKKVGSAEYRIAGKGAAAAPAAKAPAPKAAAKPAKAPKAAPVKASSSKASSKGNKRGALQEKILGALKSAGAGGIQVKALASKFNLPYRNVQVWFATTGKKHSAIKKIAPATYRLAA